MNSMDTKKIFLVISSFFALVLFLNIEVNDIFKYLAVGFYLVMVVWLLVSKSLSSKN